MNQEPNSRRAAVSGRQGGNLPPSRGRGRQTSETVTCTFRRWIIPAAEPWGACIGDINAATVAACRAYRETHGLAEGAVIADDALRFHVRDAEIVIEFTINGEPT